MILLFQRWGDLIGLNMRQEFRSWSAHADAMVQRPAVQRTLAQAKLPYRRP